MVSPWLLSPLAHIHPTDSTALTANADFKTWRGRQFAFTRVMKSLLFDFTPTDSVTIVAATFVMIGVVLLACYVPAWRAVRIDPIQSLRYE